MNGHESQGHGVFAGRDWKQYPLARREAALIFERTRAQRAQEWADFKQQWPMLVFDVLLELGGGFAFGLALGVAVLLWLLAELA